MEAMTDAGAVREQYVDETRLERRRSVWHPGPDGRSPQDVAAEHIVAEAPRRFLEVGCGTGAFSERIAAGLPQAVVVATDASSRFVDLTASRGVTAEVADVQALPFTDASFDVVAALWMLYHVPDLDQALAEIRRVLRPGGVLVAATNGDEHLRTLLEEAGGSALRTGFSSENGEAVLRRHFEAVRRTDVTTRAVFEDHAAAVAYLRTFDPTLADGLPPFAGPREYAGATTVFTAR